MLSGSRKRFVSILLLAVITVISLSFSAAAESNPWSGSYTVTYEGDRYGPNVVHTAILEYTLLADQLMADLAVDQHPVDGLRFDLSMTWYPAANKYVLYSTAGVMLDKDRVSPYISITYKFS